VQVRAHHASGDLTESHASQWVTQECIEGKRLAVGPSLAWHHLFAIASHDVGDCDAPKHPVNLRSALVGLKLLLTRPHKCFGLRAERTRDWRPTFTAHLHLPTLTSPPKCRQSSISL
jgi:hypothetical protein